MSQIYSDIEKFLAVAIFKNGCHNTTQIQHCPISTTFHVGRLWCPELIPDIEKFLPVGLFKNCRHNTAQIQHCPISTTFHMWVDYDAPKWFLISKKFLPVAIFKMAATIPHKFKIVRFQRSELIPDIEKFLPVSIFKMAATIPQKFNIVRFQR